MTHLFDWQKNVLGKVFGGQADEMITWIDEHLAPPEQRTHVTTTPQEGIVAIPMKINLEVEGFGQATACTVDVDPKQPLLAQLVAALQCVDPRELEYKVMPQRYVLGATLGTTDTQPLQEPVE